MNKQQIAFLKKIGVTLDFSNKLSDDEIADLEDRVAEYLELHGFDEEYNPTEEGLICESILDTIDTL